MLARQKRGGRDHRHLHARHGRHKRGAHRDLGLAKPHIATDQPIHRLSGMQIIHHIANGAQLIVGLLIRKARAEILVGPVRRVHHRRLAQGALGGHADELVRHLADALFELGFLGLPRAAAQPVQEPLVMAVFGQQFDILDRQVEP